MLWFQKSMLSQYQMLSLNLWTITCWPFRHLGLDKERPEKVRFAVLFLSGSAFLKPGKGRHKSRGSDGWDLCILCKAPFLSCILRDLGVSSSLICSPSGSHGTWLIGPWTCTSYQYTFMLKGPGNLIQIVPSNKGERCAQLTEIRWTPQGFFGFWGFFLLWPSDVVKDQVPFWSPFSDSEVSAPLLGWTSLRRQGSCSSSRPHGTAGNEAD